MGRKLRMSMTLIAASLCVPLFGCDGGPEVDVTEVKREYIARFLEGETFGKAGEIRAESYDTAKLDLLEVSITDNAGNMYHAERMVIIVDAAADTVSLQLLNLTGASVASGELWTSPSLVIPPEPVKMNIQ